LRRVWLRLFVGSHRVQSRRRRPDNSTVIGGSAGAGQAPSATRSARRGRWRCRAGAMRRRTGSSPAARRVRNGCAAATQRQAAAAASALSPATSRPRRRPHHRPRPRPRPCFAACRGRRARYAAAGRASKQRAPMPPARASGCFLPPARASGCFRRTGWSLRRRRGAHRGPNSCALLAWWI
jgi:hypothetical protein